MKEKSTNHITTHSGKIKAFSCGVSLYLSLPINQTIEDFKLFNKCERCDTRTMNTILCSCCQDLKDHNIIRRDIDENGKPVFKSNPYQQRKY